MSMGDKAIEIHTSQLEEKASAVRVLTCYASYVGVGFLPYLESTLAAVLDNLTFFYNAEVRASSYKALPHLLRVAVLAVKAGTATAPQLMEVLSRIVTKLLTSILMEPNVEVKTASFAALRRCLELIPQPCLTADQLDKLGSLLRSKLFSYAPDDGDDVSNDAINDDNDGDDVKQKEEQCLTGLTDLICTVFKYHGDSFAPAYAQHLHQLLLAMAQPQLPPTTIARVLAVFAGVVKYSPALAVCNFPTYMEAFLTYAESPAPAADAASAQPVKCAAFRGLEASASAAKISRDVFAPFAQRAVKVVHANLGVTEGALAAMGAILEGHPECVVPLQEGIASFLRLLPAGAAEGRRAHHYLCAVVQKYPAQTLGDSFERAPLVLSVFAKIAGTPYLSADDVPAAKAIVSVLFSKMAPPGSSVPPEVVAALQAFITN